MPRRQKQLTMLTVEFDQNMQMVYRSPIGEILKTIKETQSLASTARATGVSYMYLWKSLIELGKVAGSPLFESKKGGSTGGITKLTSKGERLLFISNYLLELMNNAVNEITTKENASVDLVVIGSQCGGLDVLLQTIRQKKPSFNIKVTHTGSTMGLEAVNSGEADVAGIHLLDEETGQYNLPFIKRFGFSKEITIISGYLRRQGLIVKKGNPKGIQGLKDILLGDLIFINRNKGSGTRVLLDVMLKQIAQQRGTRFEDLVKRVKGYNIESSSSIEVADAVFRGNADVGLGTEMEAVTHGLDFILIAEERYDFAIKKDKLNKQGVKIFLEALGSNEFKELLNQNTTGLQTTSQTSKFLLRN